MNKNKNIRDSVLIPFLIRGNVEKIEAANILKTSLREARREISRISDKFPVISHSAKKGYRICDVGSITEENYEYELIEINKTIAELRAKANALNNRTKMLVTARNALNVKFNMGE